MNKKSLTILIFLIIYTATTYAQSIIWVCSNHSPQHQAYNLDDMQRLTNRYGCVGWHQLNN